MGIRDFRFKVKAFRVKFLCLGNRSIRRNHVSASKPSWMMPISHGHHVVEHDMIKDDSDDSEFDSVVIQREQIGETELWYFGIFDALIGDCVTKYLQSNYFEKNLKESQLRRKAKETLKRAYLGAKTKVREANKSEETCIIGSTSVLIINGEKLVLANIGDYRTVLCKDGVAYQTNGRYNQSSKKRWYRRLFSGESGNAKSTKYSKALELVVGGYWIDSSTEFVILASNGIWEVMKNQEAVNLIRHIEDPQEAAECLAKEALVRRSKSNISCLIIRFD
ncbi:protein-serine/threonine phosphatase [Trifolium repens]|nr:phosphatase 2C protein [Trifolium repens]WJX10714.1 protein-serine/threonine phosphatase [Trifolium repens]